MSESGRAAELAARFQALHGEVIAFAQGCSDADWSAVTVGEGWPVGVVLDHVADGYATFQGWVAGYAEGRGVQETREQIDAANARHADESAGLPREETLQRLRTHALGATAAVRELSDDLLALTLPMATAGGRPVSGEQLVEALLRHTSRHLESCRQARPG